MLVSAATIPSAFYRAATVVQLLAYGVALLGLVAHPTRMPSVVRAAASFVMLNAAAWVAFWVWLAGRTTQSWNKTHYGTPQMSLGR